MKLDGGRRGGVPGSLPVEEHRRSGEHFVPVDRNKPGTLEELYEANDVELFDLQTDPSETRNIAVDREKDAALIATMNGKLEALIKTEIGTDDGREMPEVSKIPWTIDRPDL